MKSADSTKAATEAENLIVETYGEVFPDASMIELVASATGEPNLLVDPVFYFATPLCRSRSMQVLIRAAPGLRTI